MRAQPLRSVFVCVTIRGLQPFFGMSNHREISDSLAIEHVWNSGEVALTALAQGRKTISFVVGKGLLVLGEQEKYKCRSCSAQILLE